MGFSEKELIKALQNAENTQEKDIRQCKVCKEYKIRIRVGKYPDGKNTKFMSEDDQLWNGRVCPSCHNAKMANHMKNKRKS